LLIIYSQVNDAGDVFPIWGICLGFGELVAMVNKGDANLEHCKVYGQALPLDLTGGWQNSKLLGEVGIDKR
jgi:gamma-glutamyl hydrolase